MPLCCYTSHMSLLSHWMLSLLDWMAWWMCWRWIQRDKCNLDRWKMHGVAAIEVQQLQQSSVLQGKISTGLLAAHEHDFQVTSSLYLSSASWESVNCGMSPATALICVLRSVGRPVECFFFGLPPLQWTSHTVQDVLLCGSQSTGVRFVFFSDEAKRDAVT